MNTDWPGFAYCETCGDKISGSHYHCGNCGQVSGMMGHFTTSHYVNGKFVEVGWHPCCEKDCDYHE